MGLPRRSLAGLGVAGADLCGLESSLGVAASAIDHFGMNTREIIYVFVISSRATPLIDRHPSGMVLARFAPNTVLHILEKIKA